MTLALVTAGPSAIGRSLVTALAGAGHDVAFTHLGQAEAAAALVAQVQATGRRALALESDAGDEASVTRFHALAADWAGAAPRVMVNNAGIQTWSRLVDLSVADWDRVMATNLRGTFLNTKAAARAMITPPRKAGSSSSPRSRRSSLARMASASTALPPARLRPSGRRPRQATMPEPGQRSRRCAGSARPKT